MTTRRLLVDLRSYEHKSSLWLLFMHKLREFGGHTIYNVLLLV